MEEIRWDSRDQLDEENWCDVMHGWLINTPDGTVKDEEASQEMEATGDRSFPWDTCNNPTRYPKSPPSWKNSNAQTTGYHCGQVLGLIKV